MRSVRGGAPLSYRDIKHADVDVVCSLQLGPEQVTRFLGPVADIIAAVRRGPAHCMIAIEAGGDLVGFYVVHPDSRDLSCWWLGWFAIDSRLQGRGYGRATMGAIMRRLGRAQGCRRVRLLAAPDNAPALALYRQAGFRAVDVADGTGELVMECCLTCGIAADLRLSTVLARRMARPDRLSRTRRAKLARGARVHSALHGPPTGPCEVACQ